MFHGRILRDQTGEMTLKQLKIANNAQLVIQILAEPEFLEANSIILLACRRNIGFKTYGEKREVKFTYKAKQYPTLPELVDQCKIHLGLDESERVSLAKYVPHIFEWKYYDPKEEIVEKQGKKKKVEIKTPITNFDLRKFPFLLCDGDIIGVRVDSEEGAETDDFQTEADLLAKEDFKIFQEQERIEKEKGRATGKNGKRAIEHGIVFNAGF